jgi:hypothetical protein
MPLSLKSALASFVEEKSQSELIFLASVLLAVWLFAVVLPAYEALIAPHLEKKPELQPKEMGKQMRRDENSCAPTPQRMRVYKPGVGVVEMDVEDIAETTLLRGSSGGSSCSNISDRSLFVIEESDEEDLEDDESVDGACDEVPSLDGSYSEESYEYLNRSEDELETPTSSPPSTPITKAPSMKTKVDLLKLETEIQNIFMG